MYVFIACYFETVDVNFWCWFYMNCNIDNCEWTWMNICIYLTTNKSLLVLYSIQWKNLFPVVLERKWTPFYYTGNPFYYTGTVPNCILKHHLRHYTVDKSSRKLPESYWNGQIHLLLPTWFLELKDIHANSPSNFIEGCPPVHTVSVSAHLDGVKSVKNLIYHTTPKIWWEPSPHNHFRD